MKESFFSEEGSAKNQLRVDLGRAVESFDELGIPEHITPNIARLMQVLRRVVDEAVPSERVSMGIIPRDEDVLNKMDVTLLKKLDDWVNVLYKSLENMQKSAGNVITYNSKKPNYEERFTVAQRDTGLLSKALAVAENSAEQLLRSLENGKFIPSEPEKTTVGFTK